MNKHDFKIRGYIIEQRHYYEKLDRWSNWDIYYTKKLYCSKHIAEEALCYLGNYSKNQVERRITPLYEINYERNS